MIRYLFIALLLLPSPAFAKKPSGILYPLTLERVIDGDTFVASGRKIRIWGIDAPERGTPLFRVSTMYLETILQDPKLACKFVEKDRYKRDVMQCYVSGSDIAGMMVQMGMAKDYTRYSDGHYMFEEAEAKEHLRGLWAE